MIKILCVVVFGVIIMFNLVMVEGEGIINEVYVVWMVCYYLVQFFYQYKDIIYSMDIEYLSYCCLFLLVLQYDLMQWGVGGWIVLVIVVNGVVMLWLDEVVQVLINGNVWIGLCIFGEWVYCVFGVQLFIGISDIICLIGFWLGDVLLFGDILDNLVYDIIWIYDFKQMLGYWVCVVGIEFESDLKGVKVFVVFELLEFWNYVFIGEYVLLININLIISCLIVSGLVIIEQQVVQGDMVFIELIVIFEISGLVGNIVVLVVGSDGVFFEVVQIIICMVIWCISYVDQYIVVV